MDLGEYCVYVREHQKALDAYIVLDVIRAPWQATAANLRIAGGDAAGSPAAGTVLAIQGIGSGTAVPISGAVSGSGTFTTSDTSTIVDDAAFTPATTRVQMIGAEFHDTTPDIEQ
mgnify:CR=1 FL=1